MVLVNMYLGHKGKRKEDFQEERKSSHKNNPGKCNIGQEVG